MPTHSPGVPLFSKGMAGMGSRDPGQASMGSIGSRDPGIDALSRENKRLFDENKKMKQCLKLTKENCQLQTLNYISYAMTLNDDKLRKFLTDTITSVPTKGVLNSQALYTSTRGNPPGAIQSTDFNNRTTTLRNESGITDNSYGQSFQEIRFSDIQSSFDDRSASYSYGKSFPEVSMRELDDTRRQTHYELKTPNDPTIKWTTCNNEEETCHIESRIPTRSPKSSSRRSKPPRRSSKSRDCSRSHERSTATQNVWETPKTYWKMTPQQTKHSSVFHDSLEMNNASYKQSASPHADSSNRPPMRFGLNPNPMQQNPYTNVSNGETGPRSNSYKSPKLNSYSTDNSIKSPKSPNMLCMSDLENSKCQPTGKQREYHHFRTNTSKRSGTLGLQEYSPQNNTESMPMPKSCNQCLQNGHRCDSGYCVCEASDTTQWKSMASARNNCGNQAYESSHWDIGEKVCPTCRSTVTDTDFSKKSVTQRSPFCKHVVKDNQVLSSPKQSPEIMVRVNTTFGRTDNNNYKQTMRFSDVYTVPNSVEAAQRTGHAMAIESAGQDPAESQPIPTTTNPGEIYDTLSQKQEGRFQQSFENRSYGNAGIVPDRNKVSSHVQHTPNLPDSLHEYAQAETHGRLTQGSQQLASPLYQQSSGQPTVYFTPAPVANSYSSFEPASVRSKSPQIVVRDDDQYTGPVDYSCMSATGTELSQPHTVIGDPMATSTPVRSPRGKQKRFVQEQQSNLPQIEKLLISPDNNNYETIHTRVDPIYSRAVSPADPSKQPITGFDRNSQQPIDLAYKRCASAPPLNSTRDADVNSRAYEAANGVSATMGATLAPERLNFDELRHSDDRHQDVSLSEVIGIFGRGAEEKAKSYFYRPVDALIGYTPCLSGESHRLLQSTVASRRMVGEIAFQLDRRVLEFVISGCKTGDHKKSNFRYYGYSLTNVHQLIMKAAKKGYEQDPKQELALRNRFNFVLKKLQPLGYMFDIHAEFSQDMVNKYGLLNISDDQSAMKKYGLVDIGVIRLKLCQILKIQKELENMMIIFDCLCLMAFEDGRPVFIC